MKYLLSVDGGGTKTEFCIRELNGERTESFFAGTSNYKSVGLEEVSRNFREGLRLLREERNIGMEDIAFSVWGISGCDSENDYKLLEDRILKLGFDAGKTYLCNDGMLAYYAQAVEPGIVIIAGTGSIVIGVDDKGVCRRSGGWGYNISDVGSGYWIGNEVLKKTLFYCDGLCGYSRLYEQVRKLYGAGDFEQLPYKLTGITDYFEVAGLARTAVELSSGGEEVSRAILQEGGCVLADLVKSTYQKLGFREDMEINIVFSGGVLKSEEYIGILKAAIAERINIENVTFLIQENAPAFGGIKLAERILKRA